jgi:SAM-dependent methyltransferase
MAGGPQIFDRVLVQARHRRAAQLGPATFLLDRAAEELVERLATVTRRFDIAADIGTPTEALASALRRSGQIGTVLSVRTSDRFTGELPSVVSDPEAVPFGRETLDLVVSALALQSVNDLPGVFIQIRRVLRPDGLFLAAFLGGDTLTELRESLFAAESEREGGASPRVAPFTDVRAAGALLQRAGFALPVVDSDRLTVRYATPFVLMHDLRRMGATNALVERRRTPLRRGTLLRAAEIYARRFSDPDGKVRATFDVIWVSGWAPHESQQQPLRPGSARARLAEALGTREMPAGEKTGG